MFQNVDVINWGEFVLAITSEKVRHHPGLVLHIPDALSTFP